ncbi:serine hydrolase [Candidatus Saccharibacteria bacterium]|nr:serine hydrolase [Candidatus Saccharibacteria bacterium]
MPSARIKLSQIIVIVICILVGIAATIGLISFLNQIPANTNSSENQTGTTTVTEEDTPTPDFLDLQYVIDDWQTTVGNNVSVAIYDLDNQKFAGRANASRTMSIASLYKLFVAYEGYLRIERGQWQGNEQFLGSYTRSECLDLMLRESYSPCAEKMAKEIGWNELNEIYQAKGFANTDIARTTSTATDLTKLMQLYYNHTGLSEETWDTIKDALLNQPASDKEDICEPNLCYWRQGLPAGFNNAKVYNKVGWLYDKDNPDDENSESHWQLYNDAAIVEFSGLKKTDGSTALPRHYIVIVLTKNTPPQQIVTFARSLEKYIFTKDDIKI